MKKAFEPDGGSSRGIKVIVVVKYVRERFIEVVPEVSALLFLGYFEASPDGGGES